MGRGWRWERKLEDDAEKILKVGTERNKPECMPCGDLEGAGQRHAHRYYGPAWQL